MRLRTQATPVCSNFNPLQLQKPDFHIRSGSWVLGVKLQHMMGEQGGGGEEYSSTHSNHYHCQTIKF